MPSWGPTRWGGACAVKRFGEAKTLKSAEFTSDDLSKITGLPHGAQRRVGLAWARSWRNAQRNISRTSKSVSNPYVHPVGQRGYRAAGAYPGGTGSLEGAAWSEATHVPQNMPAPLKHFQNK